MKSKRKLIWKGTLKQAEEHPLYNLGQEEYNKRILKAIKILPKHWQYRLKKQMKLND